MSWPGKDPSVTGSVKLGIRIVDSWSDLGDFFYYD
jgi:hypothetical protein